MRRYETILIAHVDLAEDDLTALIDRCGTIITERKGILVKVERWGKRKLAYLIKKQPRGFYILFDYACETAVVNELERNLKIHDRVLKFMTVLKDETADPAALEKEIAEAAQAKEKKQEAQTAGAETPPVDRKAENAAPQTEEPQAAPEETKTETKGDH